MAYFASKMTYIASGGALNSTHPPDMAYVVSWHPKQCRLILTQISVVNFSRLSGLSAASASDRVYDIDGPASAECQASVGLLYELTKNWLSITKVR